MDKVDETIDSICDWIQIEIKETGSMQDRSILPEIIKSLAILIIARGRDY